MFIHSTLHFTLIFIGGFESSVQRPTTRSRGPPLEAHYSLLRGPPLEAHYCQSRLPLTPTSLEPSIGRSLRVATCRVLHRDRDFFPMHNRGFSKRLTQPLQQHTKSLITKQTQIVSERCVPAPSHLQMLPSIRIEFEYSQTPCRPSPALQMVRFPPQHCSIHSAT